MEPQPDKVSPATNREARRAQAHYRKAVDFFDAGKFDKAIRAASNALNRHPQSEYAASLYVLRAKAQLALNRLALAEEDLGQAAKEQPASEEIFALQIGILEREERWEEMVSLCDARQAGGFESLTLMHWKVSALRTRDRHDEALRALESHALDRDSRERARMEAILRCDMGDFAGALAAIEPVTEPVESAPLALLGLRGWAAGHMDDETHMLDGVRVYHEALRKDPEDLWCREGLAHIYLHLADHQEKALAEFHAIADQIEARRRTSTLDAFETCLAGWCCYRLGRLDDARAYYAAALASTSVGIAAEFDYALIMLADGSHEDAVDEYTRVLESILPVSALHRAGYIYVALRDLRDAVNLTPALGPIRETGIIHQRLRRALDSAAADYPPAFEELAGRMRTFAANRPPLIAVADGMPPPETAPPQPAADLDDRSARARFAVTPPDTPCGLFTPIPASALPPAGTLIHLDCDPLFASDARALYVTEDFLAAAHVDRAAMTNADVQLRPVSLTPPAWAACTTEAVGARFLDRWANALVRRATDALETFSRTASSEARDATVRHATLAALAACDTTVLYKAALILTAGSDVPAADLGRLGREFPKIPIFSPEALRKEVQRFRPRVLVMTAGHGHAADPGTPHAPTDPLTENNPIIQEILDRAYRIGQIEDGDEQQRGALHTAALVQALAPQPNAAARKQAELNRLLQFEHRFRLDLDAILVIGRDPAFYGHKVLLDPASRIVDSFAFQRARLRYGTPTGFTIGVGHGE